jgi:pimeloyl-ACP methyl ester carboxylesterase
MTTARYVAVGLLLGLSVAGAGCASPVGVTRMDPQTAQRELTSFALSTGAMSEATRIVLNRLNLLERYEDTPEEALAALHSLTLADPDPADDFFALAELSCLHAERTGKPSYYLASALYAYAFLFPDGPASDADPFDPRLRHAADLYNRGLAASLSTGDGATVTPTAGVLALPFGELEVAFDPASLRWHGRELERFVPVAEYSVHGLRNRYRWRGIGVPLSAGTRRLEAESETLVSPNTRVPVTAFLRVENPRGQLAGRRLHASLEMLVTSSKESVTIGGRQVPLEVDLTASLAYGLQGAAAWDREIKGFFLGDLLSREKDTQLVALDPYRRGRIPVVFVHGTASSSARWADLFNELNNDRRIRERFQFWFFTYDTGNPVPYSARLLREALRNTVARLDPSGGDSSLRDMVLIGHSQGGLLVKLMVVDPGTVFWDAFSNKPLDELDVSERTKDELRRALFVTPVTEVRRVIFMATPHRGSYRAGDWLADAITRFVSLPANLVSGFADLLRNPDVLKFRTRRFGSVQGMTPGSLLVRTLAPMPIVPEVAAHSIIAISGQGPLEDDSDGLVKYASAHLDGVVSELTVKWGHSVQSSPEGIEEVRRILLLHSAEAERVKP